jgi:hypothetical protein
MTTPNPISPHAAKAVTRLIGECHMMEFCDADAERIVQDAIDARVGELMETLRTHPNTVHLNILRGQFLLTREQALHIAGATDYDEIAKQYWDKLKTISAPVADTGGPS